METIQPYIYRKPAKFAIGKVASKQWHNSLKYNFSMLGDQKKLSKTIRKIKDNLETAKPNKAKRLKRKLNQLKTIYQSNLTKYEKAQDFICKYKLPL